MSKWSVILLRWLLSFGLTASLTVAQTPPASPTAAPSPTSAPSPTPTIAPSSTTTPSPTVAVTSPPPASATSSPTDKDVALAKALDAGDFTQAGSLLDAGANPDAMVDKETQIARAATSRHDPASGIKLLLAHKVNINGLDDDGATALLHVCWQDDLPTAQLMLASGADPNIGSKWNRFPLMYACAKQDPALVKALLDAHAGLDANSELGTALNWAVAIDDPSKRNQITELLVTAGAKVSLNPSSMAKHVWDRFNPVTRCVAYDYEDTLQYLLDHGGDINLIDCADRSALMWASANANKAVLISNLLDKGAKIDQTNSKGESALSLAWGTLSAESRDILTKRGAKPTDLHLLVWNHPGKKLTPAQSWELALGAIYAMTNRYDPAALGGQDETLLGNKKDPELNWKIKSREDLLKQLDDLIDHGNHEQYLVSGNNLAGRMDDDIRSAGKTKGLSNSEIETQIRLRKYYLKWGRSDGVAWDLCRYVYLVNLGYNLNYIDEAEAWDLLHVAGVQAQQTFTSWSEMSDNFLDGREIWKGAREDKFDLATQILNDPQQTESPFVKNAWVCDLSPPESSSSPSFSPTPSPSLNPTPSSSPNPTPSPSPNPTPSPSPNPTPIPSLSPSPEK